MTRFKQKLCGILPLIALTLVTMSAVGQGSFIPAQLRVDLLLHTDKTWKNGFETKLNLKDVINNTEYQTARIASSKPYFSWIIKTEVNDTYQTAYQILIASSSQNLNKGIGDIWNSGKVISAQQTGIVFAGAPLAPSKVYYWRVNVWDNHGGKAVSSHMTSFLTDSVLRPYQVPFMPLLKSVQQPVSQRILKNHHYFYDFGKDAFGQLHLVVQTQANHDTLRIHLGEAVTKDGQVNRRPGGTIRYRMVLLPLQSGKHDYLLKFKPNRLNTGKRSIHMPGYIGEVMPFRYVEIEHQNNTTVEIHPKRYAVNYPFNDSATEFESSDSVLNKVWDLCKYTMKATSFTGMYVDGDRERTPYEADAFINQLSHYATDAEYNMAKRSLQYLVFHATWPTEWSLQNLLIAWNDYFYSGDIRLVKGLYKELKPKVLLALARPDGLISTRTGKQDSNFARSLHLIDFDGKAAIRDIVDWPQKGGVGLPKNAIGETDGFVFTDYNSVVNAFHYKALVCMQNIALALGYKEDVQFYKAQAAKVKTAFQRVFIDPVSGIVKDGEGTSHSSLHANMMALAFGLVPDKYIPQVRSFIESRKMACSVYGAQFLLDALYQADAGDDALKLMTSTNKRSWYNMIRFGSTMTTEAWDMEYKGNQDWNHAWGSAPANIIVGKLMGVNALTPGFATIQIKPQLGSLLSARLKLATLQGNVQVEAENRKNVFRLTTRLPANTSGVVYLPRRKEADQVLRNGKPITASAEGTFWRVDDVKPGKDSWQVIYSSTASSSEQ